MDILPSEDKKEKPLGLLQTGEGELPANIAINMRNNTNGSKTRTY